MTFDKILTDDVPIVCTPGALSPTQQARWLELGRKMYGSVQEIRELENGFALRLPADAETLMNLAEDLTLERLCCPFLRLEIDAPPKLGHVWYRMTGREGTREFLRRSFEEYDLIDMAVAKQAGLRIERRKVIDTVESGVRAAHEMNRTKGTPPTIDTLLESDHEASE